MERMAMEIKEIIIYITNFRFCRFGRLETNYSPTAAPEKINYILITQRIIFIFLAGLFSVYLIFFFGAALAAFTRLIDTYTAVNSYH